MATGRRGTRRLLVQALYQWQISAHDADELLLQFADARGADRADRPYFEVLLKEITARSEALDERLAAALDRPLAQVDPVERAILWIGAAELGIGEVPRRVVINEAVELAKAFGAQDSWRHINAVLDRLAGAA